MRPYELILSIVTILVALGYFFPQLSAPVKYKFFPIILLALASGQLIFEGFRWQLWPLFIGILILVVLAFFRLSGWAASGLVGLSLLLGIVSILAATLLPVPKPYAITGSYQVGTTTAHLTDFSRQEIYGDDPTAPREIMVQVWYPAEPTRDSVRSPWMADIKSAAPAIASYIGLPSFALDHLVYVKANAFIDAPPVDGNFPVLIFSHGWAGFKEQNIFQVEELASHGFVVFGINHPYGAILTVFPDGREVPLSPDALPSGVSLEEYDIASNKLVRQWAGDIGFLLDELETLEPDAALGLVADQIDVGKVGVFGHSTGGGATAEFCAHDTRCKAALGMDLWAEPVSNSTLDAGIAAPLMLMHSSNWDLDRPERNYDRIGQLVDASSSDVYEFTIQGTQHYDFTSIPLLSPLTTQLGLKGPIEGDLGLEIINAYSVAFFDAVLRTGGAVDVASLNAKYPDVLFGVRP